LRDEIFESYLSGLEGPCERRAQDMRNIGGGKGFLEVQSLFYSKLSQLQVSGYPSIGIFSQIVVGLRLVSFLPLRSGEWEEAGPSYLCIANAMYNDLLSCWTRLLGWNSGANSGILNVKEGLFGNLQEFSINLLRFSCPVDGHGWRLICGLFLICSLHCPNTYQFNVRHHRSKKL
jgi:hypothetical protein